MNTLTFIFCSLMMTSLAVANPSEQIEPLAGFDLKQGMIEFKVKSHGCTNKNHFGINLVTTPAFTRLTLIRTTPDRCRRKPTYLWLSLPIANDIREVQVLNPFVAHKRSIKHL